MNQEEQNQIEADRIDVIDYIKIISKRRWLILGFLLVFLIITGILTFLLPTEYKAETLIEIGGAGNELWESPTQIVEKINSGVYGDYLGIKAENPKNTNLVKIEITSKDKEDATKALENISESILRSHESRKAFIKAAGKRDVESLQAKLDALEEKKKDLGVQLDILEKIPPYQQTITIQLALFDIRDRVETKEGQIESLYLKIGSIQKSTEDIFSTKVIKEPTISIRPIITRILFNMVVAGILGLFFGIFFAFGKEWWNKNRLRLRA